MIFESSDIPASHRPSLCEMRRSQSLSGLGLSNNNLQKKCNVNLVQVWCLAYLGATYELKRFLVYTLIESDVIISRILGQVGGKT